MRYIVYASGFLASVLVVAVAIGHLPQVAHASLEGANTECAPVGTDE